MPNPHQPALLERRNTKLCRRSTRATAAQWQGDSVSFLVSFLRTHFPPSIDQLSGHISISAEHFGETSVSIRKVPPGSGVRAHDPSSGMFLEATELPRSQTHVQAPLSSILPEQRHKSIITTSHARLLRRKESWTTQRRISHAVKPVMILLSRPFATGLDWVFRGFSVVPRGITFL